MLKCEHCQGEHSEREKFCPNTGKLLAPERLMSFGTLLEGRYRIENHLGSGGMSVVYGATHTMLKKKVAVKLLLPEFAANAEMMERSMREAQAVSSIEHANIVSVTDLGRTEGGLIYIVMELLGGRSLSDIIKQEAPLDVARAARLTSNILAGLEAVHRQGIIHRDLKPSNINVSEGEHGEIAKILDFGISKIPAAAEELAPALTTIGKVMGTPLYMAPEQAQGATDLDHRVDIYACGAILYAMVTGQPPVKASNFNALMAKILEGKIARPSSLVAAIPATLDALIMNALVKQRELRYQDAATFGRALAHFIETNEVAEPPTMVGAIGGPSSVVSSPYLEIEESNLAPLGSDLSVDDAPPSDKGAENRHVASEEPAPEPLAVQPKAPAPERPGASLRLDHAPPPAQPAPAVGTIYAGPQRHALGPLLRIAAILALLFIALAVGWQYKDLLLSLSGGGASEKIFLLVETEPAHATVHVDGVLQVTNPILLPRTESTFSVRVQAPGYIGKVIQVKADRTHSIQVKLTPRPAR